RPRDARGLPAKPAVDKFAGTKFTRIAFDDLTDGERAHRAVERHGRAVVPFVVGPAALRGIDGKVAVPDQDFALAGSGHRLRHQRKVLGLRYPTRPRHEPDLPVFTKGHNRSSQLVHLCTISEYDRKRMGDKEILAGYGRLFTLRHQITLRHQKRQL